MGVAMASLIDTTANDFLQPGTQPQTLTDFIFESTNCNFCHGFYDPNMEPYTAWTASMMGQSARDPVFWATMAIANQDAAFAGEFCIRCHAPGAWLEGRSLPPDGSAFIDKDFDGVNCHFCHRMVDPIYDPNANPPEDAAILAAIDPLPPNPHNGMYIVDPLDRRRAPFDLGPNFPYHPWLESPFHRESEMCATCHDVSNPVFTRQPDGTYALNDLDQQHPTHSKYDEFPLERTYSEWSQSEFAQGPVEMGGRFGGNITAVSSCQDCHMPKVFGTACVPGLGEYRNDVPQHTFNGANTWVLRSIRNLFKDWQSGLTEQSVNDAYARTVAMLQAASDMELSFDATDLVVRIINQSGHKLPTGYPEGRRMWLNVRFLDENGHLVREHGAYDADTATLTTGDTKVYEAKLGIDAAVAAATGLPEGESFHFALNNVWLLDNRIPPRGFTNAGFASVQAAPVNYSYADGQYWDDTAYAIPAGATQVEVALYFQTTTKEYIEFLRDTNTTNQAGQVAYDQWVLTGKSEPVQMDHALEPLAIPGDLDGDGDVDFNDLVALLGAYGVDDGGDIDGDGDSDFADLVLMLTYYGTGG